ncbi:hypothetical protein PI125_g24445 [Phytophthora idaei]|nr:hypothetical protein PI125_g24445 [Phytophthora idaei]KAG3134330.1 hypothetical protein PI126_g18738 [Phytophthora idaei]
MAFGHLVCKWQVFKAPLEIGFKRVPPTILAACILHNWCINQMLRENDSYRIEEDEALVEGVEQGRIAQDSPQDVTNDPLDASHYRRLYESSDLSIDADTYNNSEWIRDVIVELLEREPILRPRRNRVIREQEEKEHH